jgi:hypothetical protein
MRTKMSIRNHKKEIKIQFSGVLFHMVCRAKAFCKFLSVVSCELFYYALGYIIQKYMDENEEKN